MIEFVPTFVSNVGMKLDGGFSEQLCQLMGLLVSQVPQAFTINDLKKLLSHYLKLIEEDV